MNIDDDLLTSIKAGFSNRPMPDATIIDGSFDLSYHQEAQRVDTYFRKNRAVIDRSNAALVAFNYLTPEAGLWLLPSYMVSIIVHFRIDDFIIDLLFGALASGMPGANFVAQDDLGLRMRALATLREADTVSRFCIWLQKAVHETALDDTSNAALKVWSTREH